jgi:lipid II:glycine glycyltransferase (peptidoglycan interpeptide bridge formation enzyme)
MAEPGKTMIEPHWNEILSQIPYAHVLQSLEWGIIKQAVGWMPTFRTWHGNEQSLFAAAQILQRSLPLRGFAMHFRIMYVPKGPLLVDWSNGDMRDQVLGDLEKIAKSSNAVFLKIDPDVPLSCETSTKGVFEPSAVGASVSQHLAFRHWLPSQEQIQFRNTLLIDLQPDEETLLSRMKQKTRYNIRLASKKGVVIRLGEEAELPLLYSMYAETSIRDGFVIREPAYYLNTWRIFFNANLMKILIAEVDKQPVAGLLLFHFGKTAWYMFGMSRNIHREKMATYLLQWRAIQCAKSMGCTRYDLWGAPDEFSEEDSMWGVYRFKEGLGGKVVRSIGAWDFVAKPIGYKLYTQILPRLLSLARLRGKAQTRRSIDPT